MEIRKENSFPRGGKKPALFKSSKNNSALSFLKKSKTKSKKRSKVVKQSGKKKKQENSIAKPIKEGFTIKYVEDLKPSSVQDGMLLLGIVSKIMENIIIVSLPGGLRGAITVANVSQCYKNIIEKSSGNIEVPGLTDIFCVGDVLPVKVLTASEKHKSLELTCDPKIIHEKLSYNVVENGFIMTGSIKSKEDHGFIVDFGIEHVNGFLNFNKINENQDLKIGQLVRCCVIQCNVAPGSCGIQVSMLRKDIQSAYIKKNSLLPVYCFIPGFQFEVTVKKALFEGLEVSCSEVNSAKGYIHEDYLLKKFSDPSDIEIGSTFTAALLYVKPLVNFLYFKVMPKKDLEWPFQFGEIVSGKVAKVRRTGVVFRIIDGSRKAKCFIPVSKLKSKTNFKDKSEILNLYPLNKKVSKIRLANVDLMGRYYVGATDKNSLTEKYYSISDLKCGEIVSCKIVSFGKSTAILEIGRNIKGFVAFTDMSDVPFRNPTEKFKPGQTVKARVAELLPAKLSVRLTMKPTLLREKEVLCDFDKCKKNNTYIGTVFKVFKSKVIVKFFNGIFGMIPKHLTPYSEAVDLNEHFHVGKLVKSTVVGIKGKNNLNLSLLTPGSEAGLEIGKKYKAVVINNTGSGLFLDVTISKGVKCKGFLPTALMSMHQSLASSLTSTYSSGEKLVVYCVSTDSKTEAPLFGAEDVFRQFYDVGKPRDELKKSLTEDSVHPFLFRNKSAKTKRIFLRTIFPGDDDCSVIVVKDDFIDNCPLNKHQLIFGKILNKRGNRVDVSIKICDVWDKDFHNSLELLNSYLKTMSCLVLRQKKLDIYRGDINLGCPVHGVIETVMPEVNRAIVRMKDGDQGIVEGKFEKGQQFRGRIIWIAGPQKEIYIRAETRSEDKNDEWAPVVWENDNLRGKVILINEEIVVLELKGRGKGELAFLPRRRHLNDILSTECVIAVGEELKLWITRKDSNYTLAMDRRIVAMQEKLIWKKSENKLKESVQSLKRKLESEKMERLKKRKKDSESEDVQVVNVKLSDKPKNGNVELLEVKEEVDVDGEAVVNPSTPRLEYDDVDIKSEADEGENEKLNEMNNIQNDERIELSSSSESDDEEQEKRVDISKVFKVGFNWDVLSNHSLLSGVKLNKDEPSSEDEEDDAKVDKKKRIRLTAMEKKEKAKSEEERLRFMEERLMDTEREPESADDFDRVVLSDPNSSALWLKYMAFHIQGTEIEKARAVARRALKAISFREEQERLNVWIAFLNLENMYGTEDSLNKVLTEAVQVNEPYKIHLHMLNIYGQDNKFQEMEKLGSHILKKYKNVENIWCDVAAAYFSVGKVESARSVLQKALTVLEKHQHVPVISKFAQMENKHGSPERAQTLYESILASFPKRVDIWCCYVDMLIKSNYIDLARQVLERATSQSLRPRKMKTLFKKFIAFEEVHGTSENVEKVREAAVEYVQTVGSADD